MAEDAADGLALKVVAVGDGAVGKTSLLTVLNGNPFPERYVPTVFENHNQEVELGKQKYTLRVWDTAGQEEYDRLRPLSYSGARVILVCFSVDSRVSYQNVQERWLAEVEHYVPSAKVILVGMKVDLRQAGNMNHVTDDEARAFVAGRRLSGYVACSAKSGVGVEQVFPMVIRVGCKKSSRKCVLV